MSLPVTSKGQNNPWPRQDFSAWADTSATLHLWTQVVGKIRSFGAYYTAPESTGGE